MRQRLLSAAVLVPVVVILFWLGPAFIELGILVLAALAGFEVARLVQRAGLPANLAVAVVIPPLMVWGLSGVAGWPGWFDDAEVRTFVAPAIALWVIGAGVLSLVFTDPQTGFKAWVGNLVATLYPSLIGFAAGIASFGYWQVPAHNLSEMFGAGRLWLLILLLTVWSLDSAAFVVGRYLPRGHFMNHISPNKTWSGAIGGTVAAIFACTLLAAVLLDVNVIVGALTGLLIAVSAQAGDLLESMLKRAAGVKDSGSLIPGHGGILDRLDSFLVAAPVTYTWLLVLMHNGLAGTGT